MCNVKYSVLLLWISLYIYARPGVFMNLRMTITQHGRVFDSVTIVLISLWKLSFLDVC